MTTWNTENDVNRDLSDMCELSVGSKTMKYLSAKSKTVKKEVEEMPGPVPKEKWDTYNYIENSIKSDCGINCTPVENTEIRAKTKTAQAWAQPPPSKYASRGRGALLNVNVLDNVFSRIGASNYINSNIEAAVSSVAALSSESSSSYVETSAHVSASEFDYLCLSSSDEEDEDSLCSEFSSLGAERANSNSSPLQIAITDCDTLSNPLSSASPDSLSAALPAPPSKPNCISDASSTPSLLSQNSTHNLGSSLLSPNSKPNSFYPDFILVPPPYPEYILVPPLSSSSSFTPPGSDFSSESPGMTNQSQKPVFLCPTCFQPLPEVCPEVLVSTSNHA